MDFATKIKTAALAVGGRMPFSQACDSLLASPTDPNETVTVSVIDLQNLLRSALRQIPAQPHADLANKTPQHIVIMHDPEPDLSWVDDDPNDHVALAMIAYDENDKHVDSLFGIDFYQAGNDWCTGTFYKVSHIPPQCTYLREIATDMGLPA